MRVGYLRMKISVNKFILVKKGTFKNRYNFSSHDIQINHIKNTNFTSPET